MKIEVTTAIAMEWFHNWNRDYYTWDDIDRDEYAEKLADELESYTTVLRAENGNYIVFNF